MSEARMTQNDGGAAPVVEERSAEFTPGPWIIEAPYLSEVQTAERKTIATCWHAECVGANIDVVGIVECSVEESAANACLIAAAPDLHEALLVARAFAVNALRELVEIDDFDPADHVVVQQIDAALLKASARNEGATSK